MSLPPPEPSPTRQRSDEMVTNWPMILGTSLGAACFLGLLALAALLVPQTSRRIPGKEVSLQARVTPVTRAVRPWPRGIATDLVPAKASPPVAQKTKTPAVKPSQVKTLAALTRSSSRPAVRTIRLVKAVTAMEPKSLKAPPTSAAIPEPRPQTRRTFVRWESNPETILAEQLRVQAQIGRLARPGRPPETILAEEVRLQVPEVNLDATKDTSTRILNSGGNKPVSRVTVLDILDDRADLRGLPFQRGASCRREKASAQVLQETSFELRLALSRVDRETDSAHSVALGPLYRASAFRDVAARVGKWTPDSTPVLLQVAQDTEEESRAVAAEVLAGTRDSSAARTLLARVAIFDLSFAIRQAVVEALRDQPRDECRAVFLAGLRYPWAPVADHAAEALVALDDKAAVPDLYRLLDAPDPAASYLEHGKWQVRELVAINHLRNCLLCHAPSFDRTDLARAPIPEPGKPLPSVYYDRFKGPAITAAITYLRQDFSVRQPVTDHADWPEYQRYDYLVRVRELSEEEQKRLDREKSIKPASGPPRSYPQREAVLFALRHLSGKHVQASAH